MTQYLDQHVFEFSLLLLSMFKDIHCRLWTANDKKIQAHMD